MKRKLFVFALAVCLLLVGCMGPGTPRQTLPGNTEAPDPFNSPEPMPGFDADNRYIMWYACRIQEAGEIVFGGSGRYMYYYDMASGVSGVMCPNPECTHDSMACGAYTERMSSLAYYNGKRYWISFDPQKGYGDYYLWRSDLSGENQEKLKQISFKDVIMEYQPQWFAIHRGRLYFLGRTTAPTVGEDFSTRMRLMYTPLDSSEEYTAVFDETYHQGVDMTVRFVNNAIYCAKATFVGGGNIFDVTVTKYDRETGAAELLYEETGMVGRHKELWVTENGEVYLAGDDTKQSTVWRLENGGKVEVISRKGEYCSVLLVCDVVVCSFLKDDKTWAEVLTLSGETLYEGWLFPDTIPGMEGDPNGQCTKTFLGGDEDKIFIKLSPYVHVSKYEIVETDHIVMLDVRNGMKPTVLWIAK